MTVTQLECFLAIARSRSFGRAADQLGKTQPALSVQIRRLESDLGVTLFERIGRQVRETSAGEILTPYAERILADVHESRTRMVEVKGGNLGVVHIGVLPTVAAHFLPAVLRVFMAQYPDVAVILREESRTAGLMGLVQNSEIDLAMALKVPLPAGLKSHELLKESLSVAVSRQHRLAAAGCVSLAELESEKFILYKRQNHSTRELTIEYCRKAGFEPRIAFESEQNETIQHLVAANLGITILPDMVFDNRIDAQVVRVRLRPPAPERILVATWKTGRYLSTTTRRFLQCAEKVGHNWHKPPIRNDADAK
jgi:LysR family hydrogen peroxide-inducible transcriptional activator